MKKLRILLSSILPVVCIGQVFSQSLNANIFDRYPSFANSGLIQKVGGLGYFSNSDENLIDLYQLNIPPDSILRYDYFYSDEYMTLTREYKYNLDGHTLYVHNGAKVFYPTDDILFYNETSGLLDSAILESEADPEFNDYAIKHIFSYVDGFISREVIYADHEDDEVSDDWTHERTIYYTYDEGILIKKLAKRPSEGSLVNHSQTTYTYLPTTGILDNRMDTYEVAGNDENWIPCDIYTLKLTGTGLIVEQIRKHYSTYYSLDMEHLGELQNKSLITRRYTEEGLLTEEMEQYFGSDWYNKYLNTYEYHPDGTRERKEMYESFSGGEWRLQARLHYYGQEVVGVQQDISQSAFKLFPNPAGEVLHLDGLSEGAVVSVFSMGGKLLFKEKLTGNALTVDELSSGIYILEIESGGQLVWRAKFLKK